MVDGEMGLVDSYVMEEIGCIDCEGSYIAYLDLLDDSSPLPTFSCIGLENRDAPMLGSTNIVAEFVFHFVLFVGLIPVASYLTGRYFLLVAARDGDSIHFAPPYFLPAPVERVQVYREFVERRLYAQRGHHRQT